jgi:hypothetical protein
LQGRGEQAVRLLALNAVLPAVQVGQIPAQLIKYQRTLAAARAQLDEATFNAAWEAGRTLTLEQAIALAQAEPHG